MYLPIDLKLFLFKRVYIEDGKINSNYFKASLYFPYYFEVSRQTPTQLKQLKRPKKIA